MLLIIFRVWYKTLHLQINSQYKIPFTYTYRRVSDALRNIFHWKKKGIPRQEINLNFFFCKYFALIRLYTRWNFECTIKCEIMRVGSESRWNYNTVNGKSDCFSRWGPKLRKDSISWDGRESLLCRIQRERSGNFVP